MQRSLLLLFFMFFSGYSLNVTVPILQDLPPNIASFSPWAVYYLKSLGHLQNITINFPVYNTQVDGAAGVDVMIDLCEEGHTLVLGNYINSISGLTGLVGGVYGAAQLSPTSAADRFSNKGLFPYFARIFPHDTFQVKAIIAFIDHFYQLQGRGWDKIAVILTTDEYGVGLFHSFAQLLPKYLQIVTVRSILMDQQEIGFDMEQIKQSGARVIAGLFAGEIASQILMQALDAGITGDGYVWVLSSLMQEQTNPLFAPDPKVIQALRGAVLPAPYIETQGEARQYISSLFYNLTGFDAVNFVYYDFDVGLMTAYAVEYLYEQGLLRDGETVAAQVWFDTFTQLEYTGATGTITLDEFGDRIMDLAYFNYIPETQVWEMVGLWNNDTSEIQFTKPIIWADNTTKIPDLDIRPPFQYWSCDAKEMRVDPTGKTIHREVPDGGDVNDIDSNYYCDGFIDCQNLSDEAFSCTTDYPALFISYGVLTGILMLSAVCLIVFVIVFGFCIKRRRVSASSPLFLLLIIISCIVGMSSTFAWYGKPHPVACGFQPWLLGLGTISLIAALAAKTFRIWRIFKSPFTQVIITDLELVILWALIMIPAIIILALWTLISTPTAKMETRKGMEHYVCATGGFTGPPGGYIFFAIFVGYACTVVGFALFLSIVTRKVPTIFNESRLIAISMYNITFLAAVGIPVVIVLQYLDPFVGWIVRTSAILYVFAATLVLQFLPKCVGLFLIDRGRDYEFKNKLPLPSLSTSDGRGSSGSSSDTNPSIAIHISESSSQF